MTIGALHNSYIDFNRLEEPSDLNTFLFWRYYLELFGDGKFGRGLIEKLDEQLFLRFKWTEENRGFKTYEALFLILSLPISLFDKNIPDAIAMIISENEELNYLKDELITRVLHHHLLGKNVSAQMDINIQHFQSQFNITDEEVYWLKGHLLVGKSYIAPKELIYGRILPHITPLDILYVCLNSGFDPIRYDSNLPFLNFLKQLIMELSPNDQYLYELLKLPPNNDTDHLGKAVLLIPKNKEYTSILFKDKEYIFTRGQGQILKLIHKCYLDKDREGITWTEIKNHPSVGSKQLYLSEYFKGHKTYRDIIKSIPPSGYSLNID